MSTYLRRAPLRAKQPTTPPDLDCQLAREVAGLARAFVARPWAMQLVALVRLRLVFTRDQLWSFRAAPPRDFHTRDQLAQAERLARQLYDGARSAGKGKKIRQR